MYFWSLDQKKKKANVSIPQKVSLQFLWLGVRVLGS